MEVIVDNFDLLLTGAMVTVYFSVVSIVLGTSIGILLGALSAVGPKLLKFLIGVYVFVVRGIPSLVLLFLTFYTLPAFGIHLPALGAAIIAISLYGGAFFTEIVRGGILSLPRGQTEAALALGMTYPLTLRLVVLPQAIKYALPPYITMATRVIRTTSIVFIVSVSELTLVAREIMSRELNGFYVIGAAMLFYFVLSYPLSRLGVSLEKRFLYGH